jgi:large subunit ribosomal protein L7/L12
LVFAGADKINVIKAIGEVTGFELSEAKDLADSVPSIIRRALTREEAETIARFPEIGARVAIS